MPVRFHHLHLTARDPELTAAWYVRAFGFDVVDKVKRPAGDLVITCRTDDGVTVLISGEKPGQVLKRGDAGLHLGLEHFALVSEDIDKQLAHLKSLGTSVLQEPVTVAGNIRFAYIAGPDDVRIELVCFPKVSFI